MAQAGHYCEHPWSFPSGRVGGYARAQQTVPDEQEVGGVRFLFAAHTLVILALVADEMGAVALTG
jgi:hypothetical protein